MEKTTEIKENHIQARKEYCREIIYIYKNILGIGNIKKVSALVIGCGDGTEMMTNLVPFLPTTITRIVGVDSSWSKVRKAAADYKEEAPRIMFKQMDLENKISNEIIYEKYDHVFVMWDFHWLLQVKTTFQNLKKLMKPEAIAIIWSESKNDMYELLDKLLEDEKLKPYFDDSIMGMSPFQKCTSQKFILNQLLFTAEECGFKRNYINQVNIKHMLISFTYFRVFQEAFQREMNVEAELVGDDYFYFRTKLAEEINIAKFTKIRNNVNIVEIPMVYCTVILKNI